MLSLVLATLLAVPPADPLALDATLPVLVPDDGFRAFPEAPDPALGRRLAAVLAADPAWRRLIGERRLAVGLLDLSRLEAPRWAGVDVDHMMYAASLPKIALLLAAEEALERGEIAPDPVLAQDLHDMIRVSSNPAATRTLDRLGYERVARVLRDPRYGFFDPAVGGGLWVGKRFAREGPRFPDPLRGLVHAATARQVLRFYHDLVFGRLVSPERSRAMLDCLAAPGIPSKFVCELEERAPGASLYRKSGTWRTFHSDSVLVWEPDGRRYVLVALAEDSDGERLLQRLVPAVEGLLAAGARGD